jgi:hypothetical protein
MFEGVIFFTLIINIKLLSIILLSSLLQLYFHLSYLLNIINLFIKIEYK